MLDTSALPSSTNTGMKISWIEGLRQLREAQPCFDDAQEHIEHLIRRYSERVDATVDPRITHVIERLRDTAAFNVSVK